MKKKRKILLLEPNYKNKYPPIGLMKLATYHRMLGDNVTFYKGDLKDFILNNLYNELIIKLSEIDEVVSWSLYKNKLIEFLKTSKKELLKDLARLTKYDSLITTWLIYYKDIYRKKEYLNNPKWDRICVTTLFTFNWKITIETIEFAKKIIKNKNQLFVGGVLATVLADEVEKETGIKTHKGLLNKAGDLDNNDINIDELPLDYSILEEIDYKYPENNAFFSYMTRGCIRKCSFCAVWKIEPKFNHYISLKEKVESTKKEYGDRRNLLLLDNNVLASKNFPQIIEEIKGSGFVKGAKFTEPNYLDIAVLNLRKGNNDRAYLRQIFEQLNYLLNKLKGEKQQELYNLLDKFELLNLNTVTKNHILQIYPKIKDTFEKYRNKVSKSRYVDFNQGVDARLINEENIKLLSEIPIKPLRIAFDRMSRKKVYVKAIRLAAEYNIRTLSNYLLYNEQDKPKELYQRLEINIILSEELDINIYSFPMKFHPINGEKRLDRAFLGTHWNRKYIRAIQTILNATKGKVGRGKSFFYEAFGRNLEEFGKILLMPETYILHRFFFADYGYTEEWWNEFNNFENNDRTKIIEIIEKNEFREFEKSNLNTSILEFIQKHYLVSRGDIENPKSKYYKEKKEYDLLKSHHENHAHLQFTPAITQPKVAKEYSLPMLIDRREEENTIKCINYRATNDYAKVSA